MLHSDLDRVFAALADPVRRAMLERLTEGPASASDLGAPHDMTLSAVVQHLKLLEASGLVSSEKIGRVRTFTLRSDALRAAEAWIGERRLAWDRDLDRLEALLAEDEKS
jgi:DNA-binding transcriptional ArsR family regulator